MNIQWRIPLFFTVTATYLMCLRGTEGVDNGCKITIEDPGPCTPPSNASAPTGLRGYGRFHANDSLIGRPVPCTRDDKLCFRHNLIFDPELDRCEPLGPGDHSCCDRTPNRTELEHGSGRVIGICRTYQDPCPGYRMAYDRRCYKKEVVRDFICGCGVTPTFHLLGDVECRDSPPTPIKVQQPQEDDRCLIPDLRFPDTERSVFFQNPSAPIQGFQGYRIGISFKEQTPRLKCEPAQADCFSERKVRVSGFDGCYDLLEKGPCPDDHVVAMDSEAALKGRAEAVCIHVRGGCPTDHKRMIYDGQCHEDREIQVGAPGEVTWNQYGQFVVIPRGSVINFNPAKKDGNTCEIQHAAASSTNAFKRLLPPCNSTNKDGCDLLKIFNEPPIPEV